MSPKALDLSQVTPEWRTCFEQLLDSSVSEVETNGPGEFFIKRRGQREKLPINVGSDEAYIQGIEQSLIPLIHTFASWERDAYIYEGPVEFMLQGQRIKGRAHIILPPASDRAQITIAKKAASLTTLDNIASRGSMAQEMKDFLEAAVQARLCTALSGGTGAGKTTMLEAMTKYIDLDRRIGVAEDSPELELVQENVSYLHSVPWSPGMDPNKVATLAWCVAQFNRMRTDLLIVGETRGPEFAAFLTAANSGMEGCLTTLHSNTPRRCLDKMSSFAMAGSAGQPQISINRDIANAVDLIVQLIILPDGRHRVHSITEVTSTVNNVGDITLNELYVYNPESDTFTKKAQMTDEMRSLMRSRGVDPEPFVKVPVGGELRKAVAPAVQQSRDTSVTLDSVSTSPEPFQDTPRGLPTGGLPLPPNRTL